MFCEDLLTCLGAAIVESIDASDHEGASYVQDLNKPPAEHLIGQFDSVIDGGTLEHVFDVRTALKTLMTMVRPGGRLILHSPANNHLGHGFFQYSPELFWRVFCPSNGFEVEHLFVHEDHALSPWYDVTDPVKVHGRVELSADWLGAYMVVQARRVSEVEPFSASPQQSDYALWWDDVAEAQPEETVEGARVPQIPPPQDSAFHHARAKLMLGNQGMLQPIWRLAHRIRRSRTRSFKSQPERFRRRQRV